MSTQRHENVDNWDDGFFGRSEDYAEAAPVEIEASIDESLDLQLISIRLQRTLIDDLKKIAKSEGLGYQPLMRQILTKFVNEKRL